ncbi:MAG: hypothetical protein RL387_723 [Bacteroidota bacterium]|jgi:tetratricopeptide (TPR) repeat protein
MLQIRNWIAYFTIVIISYLPSQAQSVQYSNPLKDIFNKGMQALRQGDTLTAYQHIQSAYTFDEKKDDISYYYLALSLAQDKPFAPSLATAWIEKTNNRIYKSRLSFLLGKYYFKHSNDLLAIKSFKNVSIDDLENFEILVMKFQQGYLYFKTGDWDKAAALLNNVRQVKNSIYYADANYYAGFIALERKDFKLALSCFQIASVNKNYTKLAPFYISQLYYFLGDIDAAMANCEKALEQKDQFYDVQLKQLMGHLLFEKKDYNKALPYLAQYAATQKKVETQDLYQLSFCYFQSQEWTKAIEGFKQLANIEDSLGQNSMYLLATSYLKIKDKSGAKNAFLLCATKSQNLAQKEISLFNYAKLCVELKEFNTALSSLDKFISNYPNSDYFNEAKSLWITSLAFSNNFIQAYDAYDKITQPGIELLKIYPNIVYGRACLYLNDGQIEKAYSLFSQLQFLPYNAKVLQPTIFWLGELSYKMGRIQESIQYLELFINDPVEQGEVGMKHAKYTLGYGYLKSNNYQKALDYFASSAVYNANNAFENYQKDAFVRMADCQMMLKQYKQALQSYQQVIDLVWNYVDYATMQKAIILGGMGQTNEKVKILKEFENLFPNSNYLNDARIELADTYINHENFQEAIAPLSKIILDKNASSFYPQANYKLGIVYFNLNKNVMALQTFRDLFAGFPTSTESDNAVEFVRNIFIEDQTPELFVQFMNDFGKSLSTNEQDSLVYRAAIIKYEQRMYPEAAMGFTKYLQGFPKGKYQLDANYLIAEIAYSKEQYDTAAKYFGIVANQAPNKFAERAALLAARLNYFNVKDESLAENYFTILLKTATQQENRMEAYKGLLRCQYKAQKWEEAAVIAQQIISDKSSATDDIQMANMSLFHYNINNKDTSAAYQILSKIIKSNPSTITADAHYQLASLYLAQNKLSIAEKTAFEVIKKQASYDFWVTKAYILLGDIYLAQKDNFNAIATYKSVAENANDESLKLVAKEKLKAITESTNTIK